MNKTVAFGAAFAIILIALPARADKPGTIGIGLGSATSASGLSGKYYTSPTMAFQAVVGSFGAAGLNRYSEYSGFGVSVDALVENSALVKNEFFSLDWNFGLGAGIGLLSDTLSVAAAGVVGLEFNFVPVPVDLVVEYRPTLGLVPDLHFEPIGFTGHLRYYFQ